jgi:hypothetical protein
MTGPPEPLILDDAAPTDRPDNSSACGRDGQRKCSTATKTHLFVSADTVFVEGKPESVEGEALDRMYVVTSIVLES